MGARTRKKSNDDHTASDDPRVPCWLPVLGNNRQIDLELGEMGKKWREKVEKNGNDVRGGNQAKKNSLETTVNS